MVKTRVRKSKEIFSSKKKVSFAKFSQIQIYQKIVSKHKEILETLFELLKSSNEKTRSDAASVLLDKILPNKKAVEFADDKTGFTIKLLGGGYVPPAGFNGTSEAGADGPAQVQSSHLASKGKKNKHRNYRISPPSTDS
jgi:hypothetical protein